MTIYIYIYIYILYIYIYIYIVIHRHLKGLIVCRTSKGINVDDVVIAFIYIYIYIKALTTSSTLIPLLVLQTIRPLRFTINESVIVKASSTI